MKTEARVVTGIAGLDTMLHGGFIPESMILVQGAPGTGKTTLAFHWLSAGAACGEAGLFVSFEEFPQSLYRDAASVGFDLAALEAAGTLHIVFTSPQVFLRSLELPDSPLMQTLLAHDIRRVVVDSLTHFTRVAADTHALRDIYNVVANAFRREGVTAMFLGEETRSDFTPYEKGRLSFVVDCVLMLRYLEIDSAIQRAILVLKMRSSDHDKAIHSYTIGPNGITVAEPMEGRTGLLNGITNRSMINRAHATLKRLNTLYLVPTPIGNLEDLTFRALRILREVRLIAAEDTRTTRKLLDHYAIQTPLTSYHEHNKLTKLDAIFEALAGGDVALVSDAGTPGISDPGFELIREAIARNITVVPLPGPSAAVTALIASGLPTDSFVYLGFLPRKPKALRDALAALVGERRTLIAYESPNRLVETLAALVETLGDRPVAVARELTKIYEEVRRGPASVVMAHYAAHEPRGEVCLVIGGAPEPGGEAWDEPRVLEALRGRLDTGESRSQAVKAVAAESGWDRRVVYDLSLSL